MVYCSFLDVVSRYKSLVEGAIRDDLGSWDSSSKLYEACAYTLLNGGKRFRPALVLMIAEALNQGQDATQAALAVEYFHTASLIVDDLPCMDNEEVRRGKPVVHKVFDEATALLASYALIASGYEAISKNALTATNSERVRHLALMNVTQNMGLNGVTGGQFLDLYPSEVTVEFVFEVIRKKTVALFEVAFVLGWLFGGGDSEQLESVKKAAHHFGMAFQMADDFGDVDQDALNECAINLVTAVGLEAAKELFHVELQAYREELHNLNLQESPLWSLADFLLKSIPAVAAKPFLNVE